jgi:adenine-specific DNA-methyltransferase
MEKLKMHTSDLVEENIEKIGQLFPNAITEVQTEDGVKQAIDFDVLRQELSKDIVEGTKERYRFEWPGKRQAIFKGNTPITNTLRPCREESVNFDNTENLYIEGDNLDVLKLLQETYLGKIKMIYIDPPYNTGNDSLIYDDDFTSTSEAFANASGQRDKAGNLLFNFVPNNESNGRFHSDWLSMMYPRLKLSKNLLTDDGVIFISIDENEINTLKNICDEIFGQENFIAELIWAAGRKNDSKYISVSHEYILCYFRNANYIKEHNIIWREKKQGLQDIYGEYELLKSKYDKDVVKIEKELKLWYKNLPEGHPAKDHSHYNKVDGNGIYFADNISWPGGGGPKYKVMHPITGKPVKIPSRGWITNEKTLNEWIKQGKVEFGKDESCVPTLKSYLKDREFSVPYSVFYKDGRAASKRLAVLMGDKVFENPKDEEIIDRLIEFSGVKSEDIVLDYFSGSATTAHSVFLANTKRNLKTKFILVQLPEIIDPSKAKTEKSKKVSLAAINLLDSINAPHNICEIGKERIRRSGKLLMSENPETKLDFGFRVLKVDSSNMKDIYYKPADTKQEQIEMFANNIKDDRTSEDLLFQVMLEYGALLSSKIIKNNIVGKSLFDVANNYILACFDEDIKEDLLKIIAQKKPVYAVFRDNGFADNTVAANCEQIFQTYSSDTKVRVI